MLYLSENIRALRRAKELTQEEVAAAVNVAPQSVSKWERGETLPDITLLPALANLFETSTDALLGMERINAADTRAAAFTAAHRAVKNGALADAAAIYQTELRRHPNDAGLQSDLAMTLAMTQNEENWRRAAQLCHAVLETGAPDLKAQHTARAALCFILLKLGDPAAADKTAGLLPHRRESREEIRAVIAGQPDAGEIDSYLRWLLLGE